MSKLQKMTKTFFIVTFIILFIFSIKYNVNATENVYTETTTAKRGDVVYFQKPESWGNTVPYIYAWDSYTNSPENQLGGVFPGIVMTPVSDNLYKYEFTTDVKYVKLIFSDGTTTNKTKDLDYICNGYIYKFDNTANLSFSSTSLQLGDTVYFEKPDSWDSNVFIYMWNSSTGNKNSDWSNTSMTKVYESDTLYSYTLSDSDWNVSGGFDKLIFGAGSKQTKDLSTVGSNLIFKANSDPISSGSDNGKYDGRWLYTSNQLSQLSLLVQQKVVPSSDIPYYTTDSYAIYKEQFDLAQAVVNSTYVAVTYFDLTSQYNKSLIALPFAYDNLKINTQILSDKINEMKNVDTSRYEQSLVDAFNSTIQNAENLITNPNIITIANMKEAITNMETAYNNLVVDKTELETLINQAKEIDTTLYTDESTENLLNTLTTATNVYEDVNASYSDVQEQIIKLNDAISKLLLKETVNNEDITDNQNTPIVEESNTNSNPYTSDTILALIGVLAISVIICIGTTIYLKKYKNK